MNGAAARLAALAWFCSLGCGTLEAGVARSVDGVTTEGRFIEPDAYAIYAVAALYEAQGKWAVALELYERALDVDYRGPEIRTRIAAVACKLRKRELADRSFAAALDADREYGPAWFELSACRKSRGEVERALLAVREALKLDPERHEVSLLAADLEELRGDQAAAWRLRDALMTHAAGSVAAQRGLLAAATRLRDPRRKAQASAALDNLARHSRSLVPEIGGLTAALEALRQGDLQAARSLAERLLAADPSNGDAFVVALAGADLAQDQAAFSALLERADQAGTAAGPTTLALLASLLSRRVSAQAAQLLQTHPE